MIKHLLSEATVGEEEFAELEAAREEYKNNRRDDETRARFGNMVEKLVEPIMNELGLFFEAEAFYNRGEIVFSNNRDTEVIIDPDGMRGRYDVQVVPLPGAEDDVSPSEISVPTMKGVAQYVADLRNLDPEPAGMVGEPEAQTELPLENKMRISELVRRLEEIEAKSKGEVRDLCYELINDLIEHDMEMAKLMAETAGKFNFKEDENFVKFLITEGIKSGSIGES